MKDYRAFEEELINLATKRNAVIACISFAFCLFYTGVLLVDQKITQETERAKIKSLSFAVPTPVSYPEALVLGETIPSISAHAAIVMDNDSKVIIFAKNKNVQFSMASTTKIMSALVAIEHFRLSDVLTIQNDPENIEGAVVGFVKDEEVFFEDLLYAMLLPSGNDAAVALAQNYPGGEKAFVEKMNKKAEELHLLDTRYVDPSGLSDSNHTTVFDLAQLASIVLKQPTLSRIVSTKKKIIHSLDGNIYTLVNLNKLLGENGVFGMKTGFTDEAGGVLVTLKKDGDRTFILVVMKSTDRFADTQKLMSFILGRVSYQSIHP